MDFSPVNKLDTKGSGGTRFSKLLKNNVLSVMLTFYGAGIEFLSIESNRAGDYLRTVR